MKMHSNTILITGGTSGIGKGLAEAFHRMENQVIITGRRQDRLKTIVAANPGMRYFPMDVADPLSIRGAAREIRKEFPSLNCVFNNAGIQNRHDFASGQPVDEAAMLAEVQTNLLGLIRVTMEFLPQLKQQPDAVLLNVSSGLAFVPMAGFPVYCATKAAVHTFTLALRQQLRGSNIKLIELIPPYVATELGGPSKPPAPGTLRQMPLETFIEETMKELAGGAEEIAIGGAKNLYAAVNAENVNRILASRHA
jgi:uncharacterized oxidoreductase